MTDPSTVALPARGRGRWGIALGAIISGIALLLLLRTADLGQTLLALQASQPFWVLVAFLLQLLAMFASVRRWQVLLQPHHTRFLPLTQIFFIAHLLNTVLPAKLGTLARILLASESEHLNVGLVLGSVAIEKVLDTLVMLVFLALLIPFVPLPLWLQESLAASVLLVLVSLLILVSVNRVREPVLNWLGNLEQRVRGPNAHGVESLVRGVLESISNLTHRREAVLVLAWTAVIWALGGAVNYTLFTAMGISVPWSAAWFVMVVLQIGTRVPALPANLGVFHYLVVLALGVYGISPSAALAYAIVLHLVVFILPAVIGAGCAIPVSARLAAMVGGAAKARSTGETGSAREPGA